MGRVIKIFIKKLASVLLFVSCATSADTSVLDNAVKTYYSGRAAQAISMLQPLAESGDMDAQYLLGNILYSLSKTNKILATDESVKWYKMAALQGSAGANSALGVIYYNRWINSRLEKDAALAISYYKEAITLGATVDRKPLEKLEKLSGVDPQAVIALASPVKITEAKEATETEAVKPVIAEQFPVEHKSQKPAEQLVKSEPVSKPEEVAEVTVPAAVKESSSISGSSGADSPETDIAVEESAVAVNFEDIVHQCTQYTQIGFDIYTETIKSAFVSGTAKVSGIEPVSSALSMFNIELSRKQADINVLLMLRDVPKSVAWSVNKGDDFAISGYIRTAQLADSNCVIQVSYALSDS